MRNLSLKWMERIGRALEIDPELLVRSDQSPRANVVASLRASGPEALAPQREAILPTDRVSDGAMIVVAVEDSGGGYGPGGLVWQIGRAWSRGRGCRDG